MKQPASSASAQQELALSSILAHAVFPGRTTLYVAEVAKALGVTDNHVIDLIEEGRLHAINIASGQKSEANPKGNKSDRKFYRIPVSAYDAFIHANHNLAGTAIRNPQSEIRNS